MFFRFVVFVLFIVVQLPQIGFAENITVTKTLKVGLRESPPFIIIEEDRITGLSVSLWESIAEDLGLHFQYSVYTDLAQMMNDIEKGEVDLSINPLTVTSERLRRFYFSQPFYISNIAFAVNPQEDSPLIVFVKTFFSLQFFTLLGVLFLVILIFGLLLWLIERRKNPEHFSKGIKGIGDGIWWSAVTMTTVGYGDKAPVSGLGRAIAIVWMFVAVIIISSFTGTISAALTHDKLKHSINTFDDLHNAKVGTVRNSSTASLLSDARIRYVGYDRINDAMEALIENQLNAVVYDEPLMAYLISQHQWDNVKLIVSPVRSIYFGFSSSKLELLENINPHLIRKIESREWQQMLDSYNLQ